MKKFFKDNSFYVILGLVLLSVIIIGYIIGEDFDFKKHLCIIDLDTNQVVYCSDVDSYHFTTNDITIKVDDSIIILSSLNKNYLISENCLVGDNNG